MDKIRFALTISRRELGDQLRDWRILSPIVFLSVVSPFLINMGLQYVLGMIGGYNSGLDRTKLIPFLMMIVGFFPISMSLIMSLESFVGEKERGTIEPLLNSPLLDWQLYLGKMVSALFLPLMASYLGMIVYLVGLVLNGVPLPEAGMIMQVLSLTTVQSVLMVSAAVAVSSQVTTVRAANLLASFIILPVAMLIPAESFTMFRGEPWILWVVAFGILMLAVLFIRVGLAHFQREELLGREFDTLNLHWAWGVVKDEFLGGARTLGQWYRLSVWPAVRALRVPLLLVLALAAVMVALGVQETRVIQMPLSMTGYDNVRLQELARGWQVFDLRPVFQVWWQNTRALLIGAGAGLISFGILGTIPLMMTTGMVGFIAGLIVQKGLPLFTFLMGFILPHGVIEIPAAMIATAAVLRSGAMLAATNHERTFGEVWLASVGNVFKIMAGVVVPMLLLAAIIEVWITPRLALWLFR